MNDNADNTEHRTNLKRTIKQRIEQAKKRDIHVAGRVNRTVAAQVGQAGSVQGVSSRQKIRITQNGEDSVVTDNTDHTTF